MHQETSRPLIAIVGVHGVGNHEPGSVAIDMVELLTSVGAARATTAAGAAPDDAVDAPPPGAHPRYTAFQAHDVVLALRRLGVAPDPWTSKQDRPASHLFRERRGYFEALRRSPAPAVPGPESPAPDIPAPEIPATDGPNGEILGDPGRVSHEFLRLQLECYHGEREPRVHQTVRWEGRRDGTDPSGAADVHVYEMHYADLSRGGSTAAGFFRGLYQLLLHLPTLGRQAIDAAVAERRDARWRWTQDCYTWSVRMLTLGVPVLNVVMLLVALALLPALKLPAGAAAAASIGVAGLAGYALALAALRVTRVAPRSRLLWVLAPLAALVGAAGLVASYLGRPSGWSDLPGTFSRPRTALLALSWAAAVGLGWLALTRFERVRRGARVVGGVALGVAVTAFVVGLWQLSRARVDTSRVPEAATFLTLLVFFVLLGACWTIMYGSALLAFLIAPLGIGRGEGRNTPPARRARAALRTAVLSLAWSASGLLLAVVVVWSGVFQYAIRHVDVFRCQRASTVLGALPPAVRAVLPPATVGTVNDYNLGSTVRFPTDVAVRDSAGIEFCGTPATAAVTVAAAPSPDLVAARADEPSTRQYFRILLARSAGAGLPIALGLIGAGLLVLVWMALPSVPFEDASPRRPPGDAARSRWLGAWLRTGLDAVPLVSWLFVAATFVVIPAFSLLGRVDAAAALLRPLFQVTTALLDTTGVFLAASAVVVATAAVKLGSTALDVILDVDNYLRTYPEDSTPTARIAERYASLLRYLCAYTDAGRRYDAVVIVAHSLGTAVTADVMRVLVRQAGPDLRDQHPDAALRRLHLDPSAPNADEHPLPVHLFTMGNPLRQLMNRFFPHRFWWVRRAPDGTEIGEEPPLPNTIQDAAPPSGECRPLPADLHVASWSNAYRSGDYVGRELWLDRWYQRTASDADPHRAAPLDVFARTDRDGARWEACLGTGAHTHYWDATAPDVAERLDAIVDAAVRRAAASWTR